MIHACDARKEFWGLLVLRKTNRVGCKNTLTRPRVGNGVVKSKGAAVRPGEGGHREGKGNLGGGPGGEEEGRHSEVSGQGGLDLSRQLHIGRQLATLDALDAKQKFLSHG